MILHLNPVLKLRKTVNSRCFIYFSFLGASCIRVEGLAVTWSRMVPLVFKV